MSQAIRDLAGSVLDANWLGRSTKPAPRLYPHQWSWDSAFIAIGNGHRDWGKATSELLRLFDAQWRTGLVPHIVFGEATSGYFPSAASWGSEYIDAAPRHVATSGICQPPVHATAVRRVAQVGLETGESVDPFLEAMYEPLCRWHSYLHTHRAIGSVLAEIWHPWESGMDNSPVWDQPLAALNPAAGDIPDYERLDTNNASSADRPTDLDYDGYVYLVEWLRRVEYSPPDPTDIPFRARDVLFNALLCRSEQDLAWIATQLGKDGAHHAQRASAISEAIGRELWSDHLALPTSVDVRTGEHLTMPVAGSLVALIAEPDESLAATLSDAIVARFAVPYGQRDGILIPTVPLNHPMFESTRYWRGPVWINLMWLIAEGLATTGRDELAARVRHGIVDLVETNGCWEYFDPTTGVGRGTATFSWTAALALDVVESER